MKAHPSARHLEVGVPPGGPGDVALLPEHIVRVRDLGAWSHRNINSDTGQERRQREETPLAAAGMGAQNSMRPHNLEDHWAGHQRTDHIRALDPVQRYRTGSGVMSSRSCCAPLVTSMGLGASGVSGLMGQGMSSSRPPGCRWMEHATTWRQQMREYAVPAGDDVVVQAVAWTTCVQRTRHGLHPPQSGHQS